MSSRVSLQRQATPAPPSAALVQRHRAARPVSNTAMGLTPALDFTRLPIQAKLKVAGSHDSQEAEADQIADSVTGGGAPAGACTSCCDSCADAAPRVRTRSMGTAGEREAPDVVHETLNAPGHPLDSATRSYLEPRFGRDFSGIRVHSDARAAASADAIGAQAYTSGNHLVFGAGEYAPQSAAGRWLLSHELAHTMQQGHGAPSIQRRPAKPKPHDSLCDSFAFEISVDAIDEAITQLRFAKEKERIDKRHALVRKVKPVIRCADADEVQKIKEGLKNTLGGKLGSEIWIEANSPLGGYTGMYPGYAPDMAGHLGKVGVVDKVPFENYHVPDYDKSIPAKPADVQKGADKAAAALPNVDILYFRGHQYAQYLAPGVFTSGDSSEAVDLRYLKSQGAFNSVKLMVSTSCATLCEEAFTLFHGLFPNAILLGFRRSAPLDGGKVRDAFDAKLKGGKPLLLDHQPDVASLMAAWKAVVEGKFAGSDSLPGYYDGSTLHFFDGKKWDTIAPASAANKCKHKGDETATFPAPAAAAPSSAGQGPQQN